MNPNAILFKRFLLVGCACSVLIAGANRAPAASFADYRHRISEAITGIQQLQLARDDATASAEINWLRAQVPEKETVLLDGQSIAVNNSWFHEALNEVQRKHRGEAGRAELLARVGERLLALSEHLEGMEKGGAARNKDQDKGRLAEILRGPEYNQTTAEGSSALERLWSRFLRWLFSLLPKPKPLQPGGSPLWSRIAQVIVMIVGLAIIVLLAWKLLPRYLRSRGAKKQKREVRIVLGERLEPDQSSADLLAQAEALARSGDLRAAIRKAYIAFLCELADRKVISLAQHKTNRDYLNSVRERAVLHSSMRKLTNSFERHWYGFVPARENDWAEFRSGYQQALK
jgi:Domain of unknown function (DUF4129)